VKGVFSLFERQLSEAVFRQTEQHLVQFSINGAGRFTVPSGDYMPNLRHIPSFAGRDVNINDTWSADGELVLNCFSRPFKLIFPVQYKLTEIKQNEGSRIAIIKYAFVIDKDLRGGALPPDFPLKISGQNSGIATWDITQNKPVRYQDIYSILFIQNAGGGHLATHEFSMKIDTENTLYKPVSEKQKEKDRDEIAGKLKDSGIDVDTEKRGIVLRMGEVLFDFDSYALRPDVQGKLDRVVDIIREKYPDREIIVEGHTDTTGRPEYNMNLSNRRARSVAEYLKPGVGHDKFSYRGFGPDRPISDNSTREGRQKNRRVEIIIKLN
jgi:outer membrane protein OmpA-like peptidoglycan-associated protein